MLGRGATKWKGGGGGKSSITPTKGEVGKCCGGTTRFEAVLVWAD